MITCQALENTFSELFEANEATKLVPFEGEPHYVAATVNHPIAEIRYVKGSLPSALHELAHWCVAGRERRRIDDYGYWYNPDGRSPEQQKLFETFEIKPQAMEWLLSVAAGRSFVVSCDNLRGSPYDMSSFRANIAFQTRLYIEGPRPKRFDAILSALKIKCGLERQWNLFCEQIRESNLIPDA